MKTLNTDDALGQICRLCLSRDMTMDDVFCFSSELGKEIADIIMECAPVQIARHDKKPTYICELCFTLLKKFHQFQMQIVRSDKKLQRYLQQLIDCPSQINVELGREEQANSSESQDYNADATTKNKPLKISDDFNNLLSKRKTLVNTSVNKVNDEIPIKLEIKDEPMDDDYLIPAECVDTVETLPKNDGVEIGCENAMFEFCDTQAGNIKIENDSTEEIPLKSEEIYIPLKEGDSSLCPENFIEDECYRSNENSMNRTEPQNLNESSVLLKKSTNSTGEKPYQCDICQKRFVSLGNLKSHNLMHTGEKPYKCDICQMCFNQASNLKSHNLMHTGEKPYQCEICKKCFRHKPSLKGHQLTHTGEKPYKCDICQMCFSHGSHLKSHKLIHTGEKPYQCDICKKCFRHANGLKGHKLTHTGEKPHQCDLCQMRFRQVGHLKTHKLKHTGEKPYRCDICQMCFAYKDSLKKHKLKTHERQTIPV